MMLKRIMSCFLAAAIILTTLPSEIFSVTNKKAVTYGDVDGNGKIDLGDVHDLVYFISKKGVEPNGFVKTNADVNGDGKIDETDLLVLKQFIAEYNITLGPVQSEEPPADKTEYKVSFYDGDRLIDSYSVEKGLSATLPAVKKVSKENSVLIGYFSDPGFTVPFYANEPINKDTNVYVKYQNMGPSEEVTLTSFAKMKQSPDLSFFIKREVGDIPYENAVTIIPKDGSENVSPKFEEIGGGIYKVSAEGGFNKGCTYELTLAEGWIFRSDDNSKDRPSTIRTAAFSIDMEEVKNLTLNDDLFYLKDTDAISYTVKDENNKDKTVDVLTSGDINDEGGSFKSDSPEIKPGKVICIYVGKRPDERDSKNAKELLDPAVYVKIKSVSGGVVSFAPLSKGDQSEIYNVPENFPLIFDSAFPAGTSVNIKDLDLDTFKIMTGDSGETTETAKKKLNPGDFMTFYLKDAKGGPKIESNNSVRYAKITAFDEKTGDITFVSSTEKEILSSMDLYQEMDIAADDLVSDEKISEIQETLQAQFDESGFAEEAAQLVGEIVTQTDEFKERAGAQAFSVSDNSGAPLTASKLSRMTTVGKKFELSDNVKLTIEIIKAGEGEALRYDGGIRLNVKLDAQFEAEFDGDKLAIDLSATFADEVAITPGTKGSVVKKKILGIIPVPCGVNVTSWLDVKNFSGFSFEASIYTVAAEDEPIWTKLKNIAEDPTEVLGLENLPDGLGKGLKSVADVMDKIETIRAKIDKATELADKLNEYMDQEGKLWALVEKTGVMTREQWEKINDKLQKTHVASDLLSIMDKTGKEDSDEGDDEEEGDGEETIAPEYYATIQELMDKYSETVQKQTDWITLLDKEIFKAEASYFGLCIGIKGDFVIRADTSIAIGSNLEYEVGKRYTFWFEIGLFSPTAGNTTTDILDEHFAFQFYVMGRVALKMGVRFTLYAGIGSGDVASVGVTAELGPYVKLYGFFVYDYNRFRAANTENWVSKQRMAGALYFEFGLYLIVGFEAQALGLFEYSYEFFNGEFPLLKAGDKKYYYDSAFEPQEDEIVIVRDEDGDSSNGITMPVPESIRELSYIDLTTGIQASEPLATDKYSYVFSNPAFSVDPKTGKISVDVPKDTRFLETNLTITYLYGKLAFSNYDISLTIPLVWTNLSTDELKEFYTVSVKAGNDKDGYQTIWRKRVLKNQPFDLPTDEEIKALLGWDDMKYASASGYASDQQLKGLTVIDNKSFNYNVEYKTYSLTVNGIQNPDGTITNKTYTAKYGEKFDFSDLADTGANIPGKSYMKFEKVYTNEEFIIGSGVDRYQKPVDLTWEIQGDYAQLLKNGDIRKAKAAYIKDSVNVSFKFTGIKDSVPNQLIKKGTTPDMTQIENMINTKHGLDIIDISPAMGKVYANTTYQIVCGELIGPKVKISFDSAGGSVINPLVKTEGSILGALPTPTKAGYTFDGWYKKDGKKFEEKRMPKGGDFTLTAHWRANTYTVTLDPNGGEIDETKKTLTVTFDKTYGALPALVRDGYHFLGWFTEAENGTEITKDTKVSNPANHTLYAHWRALVDLPDLFDFGAAETGVYEKNTTHKVEYTFNADNAPKGVSEDQFTVKYMREGASDYEQGEIKNAGTYIAVVSRPSDDTYAKYEKTYSAVLKINKATRTIGNINLVAKEAGYTYIVAEPAEDIGVDDLWPKAKIECFITGVSGSSVKGNRADLLEPNTEYPFGIRVTGDNNYEDATSTGISKLRTAAAPTDTWTGEGYDTSWYNTNDSVFTLTTPGQLGGLARLSHVNETFEGKTIKLGANIDMTGHEWSMIYNFKGIFDGQGYSITNLYCNSYGYVGFAKRLSTNGIIKNLYIGESYFNGTSNVGGIAGGLFDQSKVENCVVNAVVRNTGYNTGGIVGSINTGGNIESCIFLGRIYATGENTGGILGLVSWKTQYDAEGSGSTHCYVKNCANFGYIRGNKHTGGVVGQLDGSEKHLLNSFNVGDIRYISKRDYLGAVAGRITTNKGDVDYYYYLQSSVGYGNKGLGEGGDSSKDFTNKTYDVFDGSGASVWLKNKLNSWTKDNLGGKEMWEITEGYDYPVLIDMPGKR